MTRSALAVASVVLVACGTPAPTCLRVDGRGVDGYATLDDALAVATDGTTICLVTGEHRPPSAPITHAVTIEGATGAVVTGSVMGATCSPVSALGGLTTGPDATPYEIASASAAIITNAATPVTLRNLSVMNCEVGIVAFGAGAILDHVSVSHANVATAVDDGARLELHAVTLSPATFDTTDGIAPIAILAGAGTHVLADTGTMITPASGVSAAIVANGATVELTDTTIDGGTLGLVVENFGSTAHVSLGTGTVIRNLTSSTVGTTTLHAENRITGGDATVTGAHFENIDGFGLTFDNTSSASIDASTFVDVATTSLLVQAHDVSIGDLTFTLPANGRAAALALGSTNAPGTTVPTFGTATIHGAITSTATLSRVHIVALDGTALMITGAGGSLTGAELGIWAQGSASITTTGALTISGATVAAVSSIGTGTTVSISDATLALPSGGLGVAASMGGRADATRVEATGGDIAFYANSATLNATDVRSSGVETGMRVSGTGAEGTLQGTACDVSGATTVGARADTGAHLQITSCTVHDNDGPGAEAESDATLDVEGASFTSNLGDAISYVDASGTIHGAVFRPSRLVLRGAGDRADEISVVVDDGVTRTVHVEGADFLLTGAPTCGDTDCSVVLASGTGAVAVVGVVTPNCLDADATDTMRYRGLGQSGGQVMSTAASWGLSPTVMGRLTGDQLIGALVLTPTGPIALAPPPVLMPLAAGAIAPGRSGLM